MKRVTRLVEPSSSQLIPVNIDFHREDYGWFALDYASGLSCGSRLDFLALPRCFFDR
jgi:hypothetical protein